MGVLRQGRVVGELVQELLPFLFDVSLEGFPAVLVGCHRGADALVHAEGREPRLGRGAGAGEPPEGNDRLACDLVIVGKRAQHLEHALDAP